MLLLLKYLAAGWIVLLIAIAANALASALKLLTWYGFLERMQRLGTKAFADAGAINLLWLLVMYPLLLGAGAWLALYLLRNWH